VETKDDLLDQAAREFRALHDALRGLNEGDRVVTAGAKGGRVASA